MKDQQQKVESVISIFSKYKVFKSTEAEIDKYFTAAMDSLNRINVDEEKKDNFREVAHRMIDREK